MKNRAGLIAAIMLLVLLLVSTLAVGRLQPVDAKSIEAEIRNTHSIQRNLCIINANISALRDIDNISYDINITNCVINGSVYFNNKVFQKKINFKNITFKKDVDFSSAKFDEDVNFENSVFNGTTNFSMATFKKDVDFSYSKFHEDANFKNSLFNGMTKFINSTIFKKAIFEGTRFNEVVDFYMASFMNIALFKGSRFQNEAKFSDAIFFNSIEFQNAIFDGPATFGSTKFKDIANFESSVFNNNLKFYNSIECEKEVFFLNSTFNGYTNFFNATFKKDADFTDAKFNEEITFKNATFNETKFEKCVFKKNAIYNKANFGGKSIKFNDSHFLDDVLFENTTFLGKVYLYRITYNKMYIRWKNIENNLKDSDDSVYLSLIQNFKNLGYFEDADSCYLQYRNEHSKQEWPRGQGILEKCDTWFRKQIDPLLGILYGYGVRPFYPFLWSILSIMIFTALWWIVGVSAGKNVLIFSLLVFLSGTKFFDPPKIPENITLPSLWVNFISFAERDLGINLPRYVLGRDISMGNVAKFMVSAERLLGAFFIALFILSITRTIVR